VSRSRRSNPGGRPAGVSRAARSGNSGRPGSSGNASRPGNSVRTPDGAGEIREVDLHLPSGHAGTEALERQLARVRGELNSAIRAGEREIIFIHGAGSGRLREALRTTVAAEYPSCTCHDASFTRYGYNGATAVTIRKH